jgi:hypothetical protein
VRRNCLAKHRPQRLRDDVAAINEGAGIVNWSSAPWRRRCVVELPIVGADLDESSIAGSPTHSVGLELVAVECPKCPRARLSGVRASLADQARAQCDELARRVHPAKEIADKPLCVSALSSRVIPCLASCSSGTNRFAGVRVGSRPVQTRRSKQLREVSR